MTTIHVIGNQLSYHDYHHPCRVFRKTLLNHGLDIKFFFNLHTPGIDNCDVLIFHEDNYRTLLPIEIKDRVHAIEYLESFFKRFPKVIWFDGNDSSGWLRSYVFPFIDIYAKSQVLRDKHYYQEKHPTGILHRDYVIENFNIKDDVVSKDQISEEDCKKIRVAWGRSYRDRSSKHPFLRPFRKVLPPKGYQYTYTKPNLAQRSKTIQYRVNHWPNHPPIDWWRDKTREKLIEVLNKNSPYELTSFEVVPLRKYLKELRNSIVTVSPFGLNEKCAREAWGFICGSLVFKPDVSHLQSFPEVFIDGQTYIAHAWDFSDFEEKLDDILSHPDKYEEIAKEGQNAFRKSRNDDVGFTNHFLEIID